MDSEVREDGRYALVVGLCELDGAGIRNDIPACVLTAENVDSTAQKATKVCGWGSTYAFERQVSRSTPVNSAWSAQAGIPWDGPGQLPV